MNRHSDTFDPTDAAWRGITLTPAALTHIRKLIQQQSNAYGVQLNVKQTGCAGLGYVLTMVTEPQVDDLLFEFVGVKLWVPLRTIPFIDGTEIDFVQEGVNWIFKYHNPQAQNECGCGESFGV